VTNNTNTQLDSYAKHNANTLLDSYAKHNANTQLDSYAKHNANSQCFSTSHTGNHAGKRNSTDRLHSTHSTHRSPNVVRNSYQEQLPISCVKVDFTALENDGCDGVRSLSCFWIAITQFLQITNREMSNLTPTVLRDMVGFPDASIMFEINTGYPDDGNSHGHYLQQICNIFNLSVSFFGVNRTGADASCWIGKSHVNYRDNKKPVLKENCASIATFETHYELIVSKTYMSNALNYRCIKNFKLRVCKYIPITQAPTDQYFFDAPAKQVFFDAPAKQVSFDAPAKQVSFNAPAKKVSFNAPAKQVPFDAPAKKVSFNAPAKKVSFNAPAKQESTDNLAKYTGQCMLLREYISNCEKELQVAQDTAFITLEEYRKLSLPPALINIHTQKSTQIISSIENAIDESRKLLHVFMCQINELNV
jgi:hypothetical protein